MPFPTLNISPMNQNKIHLKHLLAVCTVFLLLFSACKKNVAVPELTSLATITTQSVSAITHNSASTGGNISNEGGTSIIARGICWSPSVQPTISNDYTSDGTGSGSFTSNVTGLSPNTKYYVRAYATNIKGTAYGQQVEFTTNPATSPLITDLMSYWKMDENSGTTAADALGNWHLSFVGSPAWAAGKINSALAFGLVSSRYVERTGINSGNKNTYSLSAWIYLEDHLPNPKYIMGMNSGGFADAAGAAEVKLMITPDNKFEAMYYTTDGATVVMERISGTTITLNTWYHVVGVVNNGNIELYINGVEDNTNAVTNSISSTLNFANGRVTVGHARYYNGAYNPSRWFRGKIDEAGIWNRPLSGAEIQQIYNGGNGLQHPF